MEERTVQNILKSDAFKGLETYQTLLKYIFGRYKEGKVPSEISIAIDVFNRDADFDPSNDTLVRVHMHKLRKKLEHYYLTEGVNDDKVVTIPKGHYKLVFSKKTQLKSNNNEGKRKVKIYMWFFLLPLFFVAGYLISPKNTKNTKQYENLTNTCLWSGFFTSQKPVMIVIGDFYFYSKTHKKTDEELIVRNFKINSPLDFEQYKSEGHYTGKINKVDFTYLGHFTAFSLNNLLPFLHTKSNTIEIKLNSRFNPEDIGRYNIIFLGLYKTMGFFSTYFEHSHFQVDLKERKLVLPTDSLNYNRALEQVGQPEKIHNDYAIIARLPGPSDNEIIIVSAFHDIGIIESTKNMVQLKKLKEINTKLNASEPDQKYFELLYQINGVDRSSLDSELMHINGFDNTIRFWSVKED